MIGLVLMTTLTIKIVLHNKYSLLSINFVVFTFSAPKSSAYFTNGCKYIRFVEFTLTHECHYLKKLLSPLGKTQIKKVFFFSGRTTKRVGGIPPPLEVRNFSPNFHECTLNRKQYLKYYKTIFATKKIRLF